jgi:hypothetical protein
MLRCEKIYLHVLFEEGNLVKASRMRTNGVMNGMMMGWRIDAAAYLLPTSLSPTFISPYKREREREKEKYTYNMNCIPPERIPRTLVGVAFPPHSLFEPPLLS